MKKKLSLCLVVTLLLVMLSAVAMAWSLSKQYFEDVAQLQFSSGYYDDWGLAEKQAMVSLLQEHGLISADEASAMQTENTIDQYMINRYGIQGRSDVIGLTSILETELGPMSVWTQPTWVWYSQMCAEVGLLTEGNDTNYHFMPGDNAITEEEAIAIARRLIEKEEGLAEGALDNAHALWTYYTTANDMHTRKYPRHGVEVKTDDDRSYYCVLKPDGSLWTEADDAASSPYDWEVRGMINDYAHQHGLTVDLGYYGLRDFPLDHMAQCINEMRPVIEKNIAARSDYPDPLGLWFVEHFYGVPDDKAISQQQAVAIAQSALPQNASLDYLCYEITDPASPLWKITFAAKDASPAMTYRFFIHAYTGEIVHEYAFETYMNRGADKVIEDSF